MAVLIVEDAANDTGSNNVTDSFMEMLAKCLERSETLKRGMKTWENLDNYFLLKQ